MTFVRVAAAILMFRLIELFWNYAFIVTQGDKDMWPAVVVMTIAWLIVSALLWGFLLMLEAVFLNRGNRNG